MRGGFGFGFGFGSETNASLGMTENMEELRKDLVEEHGDPMLGFGCVCGAGTEEEELEKIRLMKDQEEEMGLSLRREGEGEEGRERGEILRFLELCGFEEVKMKQPKWRKRRRRREMKFLKKFAIKIDGEFGG